MAVHLLGGGVSPASWAPFVAEATGRAGGTPTVVVIGVGADSAERLPALVATIGRIRPRLLAVGEDAELADDVLDGADGVVVSGGLTPAYLRVLLPLGRRLRELVGAGMPYAGWSAGAMIAAERALIGGYRLRGVPVVDPGAAEDLDELTVEAGLGLVRLAVEPHAAQWGTVSRLVAAIGSGSLERGVAIDEDTAVVVDGEDLRIAGGGAAWFAERAMDGRVLVERRTT